MDCVNESMSQRTPCWALAQDRNELRSWPDTLLLHQFYVSVSGAGCEHKLGEED